MKLKYYLKGFGIGIIFATMILSVSFYAKREDNRPVSRQEVERLAAAYGMIYPEQTTGEENPANNGIESDTTEALGEQGTAQEAETIGEQGSTGTETAGEQGDTGAETIGEQGGTGTETAGGQGDTGTETIGEQGGTGIETAGGQGSAGTETIAEQGSTGTTREQGGTGTETIGEQGDTGIEAAGEQGTVGAETSRGQESAGMETAGGQGTAQGTETIGEQEAAQETERIRERKTTQETEATRGQETTRETETTREDGSIRDAGKIIENQIVPKIERISELQKIREDTLVVEKRVTVPYGMYASAIAELLEEVGVIESAQEFSLYLMGEGYTKRLQAGVYTFVVGMDFETIAGKLLWETD